MGKQSAIFCLSEIIGWTFLSLRATSWITNIRACHKSSFWDSICNQNSETGQTLILHHPYEMLFASYGQVYFARWGFTPTARSPTIQQSAWTKAHPYGVGHDAGSKASSTCSVRWDLLPPYGSYSHSLFNGETIPWSWSGRRMRRPYVSIH